MRRHLVPLLASMGLASGLAAGLHGMLRGAAAPVPSTLDPDDAASVERRAREALLQHVRTLGYQTDTTETAGFIDLFRPAAPGDPAAIAETFVERRFAFLARTAEQPNRDVFLLRARIAPTGEPVAVGAVRNLTRTADGDEAWLTPRPGQVAFTTRFANVYTGVTLFDLNGAPPMPGAGLEAMVTQALTDLVEMGDARGAHVLRFVLPEPAAELRLHWEGDELVVARREARGWGEARLNLAGRSPGHAGAAPWLRAVETQRAPRSLLSWAVDTARSLPFIGPERIYALEEVFFRLADLVQTTRYKLFGKGDTPETQGDAPAVSEAGEPVDAPETAGVVDPHGPWPIERAPADLKPVVDPPLPGEGRWRPFHFGAAAPVVLSGDAGAPPLFWRTSLRADPERPDAITELVLADGRQVALKMVGGTEHPRSSTGEVGAGRVPPADRAATLAAFNGGFQAIHGGYGMVVDRTVLLPPRPDVATVATYADGSVRFGTWASGTPVPTGLVSLRQNLPPLVDQGRFNPLEQRTWGFTLKGRDPIFTWRSGLGVTRAGHLLFAVCVRCSADTLADAMLAADVDYAMHLDMNISNIGWEFWGPGGDDGGGEISRVSLMRDMWRSDEARYTDTHTRDFFYLVRRPLFPTAAGVIWQRPPTGEGLLRPHGLWPPPVARGVLDVDGRAVTAIRFAAEALGAAALPPDATAPDGTLCRLSIHRGITGEGLPHDGLGEDLAPEKGTLVLDAAGRLTVRAPGAKRPDAGFFQQLPVVLAGGAPTATVLAGPARWALGADPQGGLWLVGGAVEMPALTAALGRLAVDLAVAPAPAGGQPVLRCGAATLIDGPPPASRHDLALGRASSPPPSLVRRTTVF